MREPTKEELLSLRRAARALYGTNLRDETFAAAAHDMLVRIADEVDAPNLCEGDDNEGVFADDEGCYTCLECARAAGYQESIDG